MENNKKTNFNSKEWLCICTFAMVVFFVALLWVIASNGLVNGFESIVNEYYCTRDSIEGNIMSSFPNASEASFDLMLIRHKHNEFNGGMIAVCVFFGIFAIISFICFLAKKRHETTKPKAFKSKIGLLVYLSVLLAFVNMFVLVWHEIFLVSILRNISFISHLNFYKLENGVAVLHDVAPVIGKFVLKYANIGAALLDILLIVTPLCFSALFFALSVRHYSKKHNVVQKKDDNQ